MAFSRTVNTCHGYAIDGRIKRSILRYIVIVCLLFVQSSFFPQLNNIHRVTWLWRTSERVQKGSLCVYVGIRQQHDTHLFVLCCQYYAHDSTLNDNASTSVCVCVHKWIENSEMNTMKTYFSEYVYENVFGPLQLPRSHLHRVYNKSMYT